MKRETDMQTQGHRPPTQRAGRRDSRPAARGAGGEAEEGAAGGNAPGRPRKLLAVVGCLRLFRRFGNPNIDRRCPAFDFQRRPVYIGV
jgi:hypothetical protein